MTVNTVVENQPDPTITKGLNVYQKINRIMQEVSYIHRDAKITLQRGSYKGVRYDVLIGKIRQHFCDEGVIVVPSIIGTEVEGNRTKMKVMTLFVNVDDPQDRFSIETYSHSDDTTDKGPGKAYTYAVKMALLKVLMLESGDNEEEVVVEHKDELFRPMTSIQLDELRALAIETGSKESDILRAYSQDRSQHAAGLGAIHAKFYALILAQLKQKLSKQKDYMATA